METPGEVTSTAAATATTGRWRFLRDGALSVAGAAVAGAVGVRWWHERGPGAAVAVGVVVLGATVLAVIDVRSHRLPNIVVGPLAGGVVAGLVVAGVVTHDPTRAARAVGFGVAALAVLLVGHLAGGVGMGDVKFVFPLAATLGWFGLHAVAVAAMATTLSAAVALVGLLVARRGWSVRLAYGPHLTVGFSVALLLVR